MTNYPFHIISLENEKQLKDTSILSRRPISETGAGYSFKEDARFFEPGEPLITAIETAVALGEPLLITGEPGTGKTQTAYFTAYKLNIEPVIHFQVKSDSTAHDLLYNFDMVRYFFDASLGKLNIGENTDDKDSHKETYIEKRELYNAFESAIDSNTPRILLIDEIDKAPRDFPNDLLHELDKMEFKIKEKEKDNIVRVPAHLRPIVFITSNSERRLPGPFLRRCIYHHITFKDTIVRKAVYNRRKEFAIISGKFLELAIKRFLELRNYELRKKPATGELLVWLRVLALNFEKIKKKLNKNLADLPFLNVLIKDHQDIADIKRLEK